MSLDWEYLGRRWWKQVVVGPLRPEIAHKLALDASPALRASMVEYTAKPDRARSEVAKALGQLVLVVRRSATDRGLLLDFDALTI